MQADPPARVLVVDDDASFATLVAEVLQARGHDARSFTDPRAALDEVMPGSWDVAVVDLAMPGLSGMELAERLREIDADLQVIVLTGQGDKTSAIAGLQQGVFDYIEKGELDTDRLDLAVRAAAERCALQRANRELTAQLAESHGLLTAVLDMSEALVRQPHPDRALGEVAAAARRLTGADASRVVLMERTTSGGWLVTWAVGDGGDALRGTRLRPGEGIVALAAESGVAILVDDPTTHPRWSERCDAFRTGRRGLLVVPVQHGQLQGGLCVAGAPESGFSAAHRDAVARLGRLGAVGIENALHHERALNFFTHTSEILVSFLDSMDVLLAGHSRAVARLSDMLSRRLGLSEDERRRIHFAALLHDIGKVQLDDALLRRDTSLTEEDRVAMQRHPALGLELLRPISLWEDLLPMVHAHHERWDGTGYPMGLKGDDIPLGARIIAVADTFDAMVRSPWTDAPRTPQQALATIEGLAGTQLEPRLVRYFVSELRSRPELLA